MAKTLITGFGRDTNLYLVEFVVPQDNGLAFEYRRLHAPNPDEALKVSINQFPDALSVMVFGVEAEYARKQEGFFRV